MSYKEEIEKGEMRFFLKKIAFYLGLESGIILPEINKKLSVAINDRYGQELKNYEIGYLRRTLQPFRNRDINIYKEFSLPLKEPLGVYAFININIYDSIHIILAPSGNYEVRADTDDRSYKSALTTISYIIERALSCYKEHLDAVNSWS